MTTITTLIGLPPDLVERDRVRRQALRAGAVRHPGLAVLREAAFAGEGLALAWELPDGCSDVPAEGMSADDAIAVASPVAAGLALLHDAGLAHGGVAPSALRVHAGAGILLGWRPGGTAAADVRDLVALLDAWLPAGSVGSDLAQALVAGADPDPALRPSMARIAAALDRARAWPHPPISPPAHRRARLPEASPEPPAPLTGSEVPPPRPAAEPGRRGRHAARRAPAGTPPATTAGFGGVRVPWRWALALGGAALVAFLGFTAVGSAQEAPICPAPTSAGPLLAQLP